MKAAGLHRFGPPEVLELVDVPTPHAGPGEIRIRVRAAAVSPADLLFRSGLQAAALSHRPTPHVPGMDVAGVVDEIGPGTETALSVGDEAMALVMPFTMHAGGYAEYVVVPAGWAVPAPSGLSLEEAATLPMNGLTALLTIDTLGLEPGSTLGVVGAAGVLGGYVVQFAVHAGLTVTADAAPGDVPWVRGLGAAAVVERGPGVEARIRDIHPLGLDAVADTATYGTALLHAVRDGGVFARFRHEGEPGGYPERSVRGIAMRTPFIPDYAGRADKLDTVRQLAASGALTPRVAQVYHARDAAAAHARLARGGMRGRIVLTFD